MAPINLWLLLLFYYLIASIDSVHGKEIILTEDKPYDVINVSIPRSVWKQALHPTPVLRSPVTITVPIHVAQDEDIEDETEDVTVQQPESTTAVSDELVVQQVTSVAIVTNVTENPIQDEETVTEGNVEGQVSRFPCSCPTGQCGCCTGAILQRINLKACGNISFIPEDFVFDVRLSVNNNTVVRRRVSASDPLPICFNPLRAPFIRVCAEISNIRIRNRNAFACLDINADIGGFQIYSASFRCFGLGSSGVQTGLKPKPVSSKGPKPVSLFGNGEEDQGGFLEDAAGTILGQGGGLFGDGESSDNGGPLDDIGDAFGGIFEGRNNLGVL